MHHRKGDTMFKSLNGNSELCMMYDTQGWDPKKTWRARKKWVDIRLYLKPETNMNVLALGDQAKVVWFVKSLVFTTWPNKGCLVCEKLSVYDLTKRWYQAEVVWLVKGLVCVTWLSKGRLVCEKLGVYDLIKRKYQADCSVCERLGVYNVTMLTLQGPDGILGWVLTEQSSWW
jgi:hypothetical protein